MLINYLPGRPLSRKQDEAAQCRTESRKSHARQMRCEHAFGSISGFIVAGIIVGPHTPGPVPVHAVEELQSVAELGLGLFLFTVGLELRPGKF